MSTMVRTLVQDFGWIHTGLGLFGNLCFFVGSVLFLPSLEQWKIWGVWLFIVGAGFMLLGALGEFMVKYYERRNGGR